MAAAAAAAWQRPAGAWTWPARARRREPNRWTRSSRCACALFASVDGACLTDDGIAELYRPSSDAGADWRRRGGDSDSDASEPAGTLADGARRRLRRLPRSHQSASGSAAAEDARSGGVQRDAAATRRRRVGRPGLASPAGTEALEDPRGLGRSNIAVRGRAGTRAAVARGSSHCCDARATRSRRSSITFRASCVSRPMVSNSARCRWRASSPCRNSPCGWPSRWPSSRSSTNAARSSATGRRRCRATACWMTTSRSSCRMDVRSNCACR